MSFGSVVRGEDRQGGDVDFPVDMQEYRSLLDLIGFQQDEDSRQTGRCVDTERHYLKDRILAEAAPL